MVMVEAWLAFVEIRQLEASGLLSFPVNSPSRKSDSCQETVKSQLNTECKTYMFTSMTISALGLQHLSHIQFGLILSATWKISKERASNFCMFERKQWYSVALRFTASQFCSQKRAKLRTFKPMR